MGGVMSISAAPILREADGWGCWQLEERQSARTSRHWGSKLRAALLVKLGGNDEEAEGGLLKRFCSSSAKALGVEDESEEWLVAKAKLDRNMLQTNRLQQGTHPLIGTTSCLI